MCFGTTEYPWSDRKEAEEAIKRELTRMLNERKEFKSQNSKFKISSQTLKVFRSTFEF